MLFWNSRLVLTIVGMYSYPVLSSLATRSLRLRCFKLVGERETDGETLTHLLARADVQCYAKCDVLLVQAPKRARRDLANSGTLAVNPQVAGNSRVVVNGVAVNSQVRSRAVTCQHVSP
jgi:hypothetical protein